MASKWVPVTDVDEAYSLRRAGLLHLSMMPHQGHVSTKFSRDWHDKAFDKDKYVVLVEEDEDDSNE